MINFSKNLYSPIKPQIKMFSDPAVLNGGLFRENFFSGNGKRNIELLMTGCAVNHLTADCRTPNRKDGKSV